MHALGIRLRFLDSCRSRPFEELLNQVENAESKLPCRVFLQVASCRYKNNPFSSRITAVARVPQAVIFAAQSGRFATSAIDSAPSLTPRT
jgi:hypothetical protein